MDAFGDELSRLAASASSVRASVVVGDDGSPAAVAVDESDVADLLTQLVGVAERRGVRFPRAFGLLLKQALYFDRYRAALAPGLDGKEERAFYIFLTFGGLTRVSPPCAWRVCSVGGRPRAARRIRKAVVNACLQAIVGQDWSENREAARTRVVIGTC